MDKSSKLQKIADEISKCKICQVGKSGLPVPGEGNPEAKIVFIGEDIINNQPIILTILFFLLDIRG